MQVKVQEAISNDPELAPAVKRATNFLEDIVRIPDELVTADWRMSQNENGRLAVDVTLSDSIGAVAYQFTPDQVKNTYYMEGRLNRLYDDLLRIHLQRLRERVRGLVQQLEED
jgi:hypothetical protein